MILMIDNYDSFTFNLVQYLSTCEKEVKTVRNDALTVSDVLEMKPELVVISPGPGRPEDAGICLELLQTAPDDLPIFGVCLGMQAMVQAFGGSVVHAPYLMHGKTSEVTHDGQGVFADIPNPVTTTRYHSLMAASDDFPDCFDITARTADDLIMAIRHKTKKIEGVQFHPESYLTQNGMEMIRNLVR